MDKKGIKQIINLNKKFYQLVSGDFSKKRQYPWQGWDRVVETLEQVLTETLNQVQSDKNNQYHDLTKKKSVNRSHFEPACLPAQAGAGRLDSGSRPTPVQGDKNSQRSDSAKRKGVNRSHFELDSESRLIPVQDDKNERLSVLDLGCGNGRFYEYISKKYPNIGYTGLDTNNDLLNEARKKYGKEKFTDLDIFTPRLLASFENKVSDLVVAFGVTHHIPDENFRKRWFLSLVNLLTSSGILALSFWQFEKKPGDYLVSWNNRNDVKRFCHQYSSDELKEIIKNYEKAGLKLLDQFTADNTNEYLVFGKI